MKHEKKYHGIVWEDAPETAAATGDIDHVKQHSEARLGFGLFLADLQDAVKEGDGVRLMRLYSVALLYYKAYGHSHYAYSTLLLTVHLKRHTVNKNGKGKSRNMCAYV